MRNSSPDVKSSADTDNIAMTDQHQTIGWNDAIRFWTVGVIAMVTCMMSMMAIRMFFKMVKKTVSKILR